MRSQFWNPNTENHSAIADLVEYVRHQCDRILGMPATRSQFQDVNLGRILRKDDSAIATFNSSL